MGRDRLPGWIAAPAIVVGLWVQPLSAAEAPYPSGGPSLRDFVRAERLESDGRFKSAARAYRAFSGANPGSPFAAEALYREGDCYGKMGKPFNAFEVYQGLVRSFPSFERIQEVLEKQYKIGNLYMFKHRQYGKAAKIYEGVLFNAPFGDLAPKAQYYLGLAREKAGRLVMAKIEYDKVLTRYAASALAPEAAFRIGVCSYKKAIEGDYDQGLCKEALRDLEAFVRAFPESDKVENARLMIEEVEGIRAQRIYEVGEYYRKEAREPEAALVYFRDLLKDHPGTIWAPKARRRIHQAEGRKKIALELDAARGGYDKAKREVRFARAAIRQARRASAGEAEKSVLRAELKRAEAMEALARLRLEREEKLSSLRLEILDTSTERDELAESFERNKATFNALKKVLLNEPERRKEADAFYAEIGKMAGKGRKIVEKVRTLREALSRGEEEYAGRIADAEKGIPEVEPVSPTDEGPALASPGQGEPPAPPEPSGGDPAARFHAALAERYGAGGLARESEEEYRKVVSMAPGDAEARFRLGLIEERRGELGAAAESFRAAIRIHPTNVAPYLALGRALRRLGKAREAAGCLEKALALDPENREILSPLAEIHAEELGDGEKSNYYRRLMNGSDGDGSDG